ncbi:hypothetical protein [Mucisphaera calidilacus]|uniref:Uncharacterized protein n=1 Tax=Mucisphaera calidilacus TaxID=2527982 RepID=A0A518BUT9_9BACT|nr:hypothetical protein [Mucisphaera calidilacus]QDU70753.1 hypothetical protein Pan265_05880 [Mucisphaera calidilacus]
MTRSMNIPCAAAATLLLAALAAPAHAQLRVVSYNTAGGPRNGLDDILQAIGDEVTNGVAKPIDVLSLQEQNSANSTTQAIVNLLNAIYGPGTYARGTITPASTGAGSPGVIYNTNTVSLLAESTVGTTSSNGAARQGMRYQFRPVGYGSEADFYVYGNHFKASQGSTNENRRDVEATAIRANADALGEGSSIIYTGDFNLYSAFEPAYITFLLDEGAGKAFDPIDRRGNWHNSSSFKDVHTQAPSTNPPSGLVGGGVDDRFDFQLVTEELMDAEGLAYITGSYHAFGNNGTHTFNNSITTGTGASPQILSLLTTVSDHLPVVADYQLPAKAAMAVSLAADRVLVGASVDATVAVTNTAGDTPAVIAPIGADELDYTVFLQGMSADSVSGSADAFAGPDEHVLAANTQQAGSFTVGGLFQTTSQNTSDDPIFSVTSLNVLDHATPSFDPAAQVTQLVHDFGVLLAGDPTPEQAFALHNLEATAGFTASLDLDAILSNDLGEIQLDLLPFAGLTAGSSTGFTASLETDSVGIHDNVFTLLTSDEDIPGETSDQLTLTIRATVAAVQGDLDGSGTLDAGDLDTLIARFGTTAPGYDLNNDAVVDDDDVTYWLSDLFGSVRGDTNTDLSVDLLDLSNLAANFGEQGTWTQGDVNADGTVDLLDLSLLASNFGFDGTPVPEPAAAMTLLALGVTRRRSRGA